MKESLYLDTSVVSAYYDAKDSKRQAQTRDFWGVLPAYEVYISSLVVEELENTLDKNLRSKLLSLIAGCKKIEITGEVLNLAEKYVNEGIFPQKYIDDAYHLSAASVNSLDYLVSWNYRHMVKVKTRRMVNLVNQKEGYKQIEIIVPPEL